MNKEDKLMNVTIVIMSGVEDGAVRQFNTDSGDGKVEEHNWTITIGRRDENDLVLRNDTFVSRTHAKLHHKSGQWWLEDCISTNGTFTENADQFFMDSRVKGTVLLDIDHMFRVGRTWLRIESIE